ncbi:GNAT family N-acetyltransferase [Candidatus Bathyarchaeota archaeon]|nr:GNAT family N-acetyltransferase [Candidatus Bathyarchaeota archaeon]
MKDHILLTSSRLTLREFTLNDYEDVYSYASDPEVVKYIPWNIYTLDDARKSINRKIAGQRKKPRDTYELAALLKEDEKLIGECYLSLTDLMEADLGFCIHRDYWGRGIATEITGILLKFGFRELNLHRIIATCDPRNQASINILEKNGFRREGYFKEHKLMRGNWRDSLFYAILDKEWKNCIRE